ncbi:MAG: hypothetical protein COV75_08035 [Candidatus Omnitrophica bacterium CG11_big_fil_rev_8_21_14_0_20_63_9]|nr:MAG: hypothetical protein COV75_08035 [Candidatus Omnitrophica bacterium CG11_big_fil_rev_8_21_14_0_20_63_9]
MPQVILSGLLMLTGIVAAGVGLAMARQNVRTAHRIHARTAARSTVIMEDWSGWFVGGFSSVTTGLRAICAVSIWLLWTAAGAALIVLGIRFLTLL